LTLNVLFVDDEPDLCTFFSEMFSSPDVTIYAFSRTEDVISACKTQKFDLGFFDFRMKTETGDDLALRLKPCFDVYLLSGELDLKPAFPFTEVLNKPYDNKKIEAILASRQIKK